MQLKERCEKLYQDLCIRHRYGNYDDGPAFEAFAKEVRREALEKAAKIADRDDKSAWGIADEIRALIEKEQD